jgi:cytochrome P450
VAETPVLDALLHETLRIAQPHVAMRRNVGPELHIAGRPVRAGDFVMYPFSDVHLDPALYPDPWTFDPARPEPKREGAFVGWGAGRAACLGTRMAKLEIKLLAAMLLLSFDFSIVDGAGRAPDPLPRPDWNDLITARPPGATFFLQHRRRVEP